MRVFRRIVPLVFLLALAVPAVHAQDTKEYEQRKARIEKEIEILDRQIAETASRSRSELSRLTLLRARIANRRELIKESDRQIRRYSDDIYLTQKKINRLNAEIDTLSAYYAKLIRSAYKNRDARVWYMYILASDDLGQAFRRYSYFRNLSAQTKVQADKIREAKEELEAQKSRLYILKKELASKKRQVEALDKEIKRIIREAMEASSGKTGKKQEIDYKLAAEFSKNKGKLPWPASGAVIDRFGQHYHPVFTHVKLPFNNGITIALPEGTEVDAVFDGTVKQIVVMPGYNQCVLVQHGNYFSFYCKLKSTAVKAGDKIRTGQKIGTVDTINGETQLHFQIWEGSKPQNPELWLRPR